MCERNTCNEEKQEHQDSLRFAPTLDATFPALKNRRSDGVEQLLLALYK